MTVQTVGWWALTYQYKLAQEESAFSAPSTFSLIGDKTDCILWAAHVLYSLVLVIDRIGMSCCHVLYLTKALKR